MKRKSHRLLLLTLLTLALFSIPLYLFANYAFDVKVRREEAREFAQHFSGKSNEEIEIAFSVVEDYYRMEKSAEESEPSFVTSEGERFRIVGKSPQFLRHLGYIWIPGSMMLLFAMIVGLIAEQRVFRDNRATVESIVYYLKDLLSEDFTEYAHPPEWEEVLSSLFQTEEQKREFIQALNQIRRYENQRRQFSANVSHELKSPLTSINGYAEMIESGMAGPEDTKHFAAVIHREGVRLLTMINEIIQLSKFDSGYEDYKERSYFDFVRMIKDELESLEPLAKDRKVTFTFAHDMKQLRIFANSRLIADVLRNLFSNAIKYSKPVGGNVAVELRDFPREVVLSVEDEGIGIAEEHQKRVFERFFVVNQARTRSDFSGTGLGLSLVKHAVQNHGGTVELRSKVGVGSKFIVTLPKNDEKKEPQA